MSSHMLNRFAGRFQSFRFLAVVLFLAAIPACSNPFDFSHCPQITGKLTRKGVPMVNALIIYTPEASEAGSSWGVATSNSKGFYRLISTERGDPLVTGWYRASVVVGRGRNPTSSTETDASSTTGSDSRQEKEGNAVSASEAGSSKSGEPTEDVEEEEVDNPLKIYEDMKTSPLKIWIRAQAMNIDINLPN